MLLLTMLNKYSEIRSASRREYRARVKTIVTFTLISFLNVTILPAMPMMPQISSPNMSATSSFEQQIAEQIKPFGKVELYQQGENEKTVIYIKDAHDSLEAQQNIAHLIDFFVQEQAVHTVLEEGYEGLIPTKKYFDRFNSTVAKQKIAFNLLDHLLIGGAEYAHILRSDSFQLEGVDDIGLHVKNIQAYQEMQRYFDQASAELNILLSELEELTHSIFTKEFELWLKNRVRYEQGQLTLEEYLKRMMAFFKEDAKILSQRIPYLTGLISQEHQRSSENQIGLDSDKFLSELKYMEDSVVEQSLKTEQQQDLYRYLDSLRLFKKLISMQITSAEYENIEIMFREFDSTAIAEFFAVSTGRAVVFPRRWEAYLKKALLFYEIAGSRDQAVNKRLVEFSQGAENKTVLVYGGFHARNIEEIIVKNKLTLLVIQPNITQMSPRHQSRYKSLLTRQVISDTHLANVNKSVPPLRYYEKKYLQRQQALTVSNASAVVASLGAAHTGFDEEGFPNILKANGYKSAGNIERGGSASSTFLARLPDGQLVIVKYSDWPGVSGNGTEWLRRQAEKLLDIQNSYPEEARRLYPRVIQYYSDLEHDVVFYAMEYFDGAEDLTKYWLNNDAISGVELNEQVDKVLSDMARTHYGQENSTESSDMRVNLLDRAKYRLGLLPIHHGTNYEKLVHTMPFDVGTVHYPDTSYLFEDLLNQRVVTLNGRVYPNLPILLRVLESKMVEYEKTMGMSLFSPFVHGDLTLRNFLRLPDGTDRIIDVRGKNIHPTSPSKTSIEYDLAKIAHSFFLELIRNDLYSLDAKRVNGLLDFELTYEDSDGARKYLEAWREFYQTLSANEELKKLFEGHPADWQRYVELGEAINYISDAVHRFAQDSTGEHPLIYYLQATVGLYKILQEDGYISMADMILFNETFRATNPVFKEGNHIISQQLAKRLIDQESIALLGLNGASGSGKTFFANQVKRKIIEAGQEVVLIHLDWFLRERSSRELLYESVANGTLSLSEYQAKAWDMEAYYRLMQSIGEFINSDRESFIISMPQVYNRETGRIDRSIEPITLNRKTKIIVEGVASVDSQTWRFFTATAFFDVNDHETLVQSALARELNKDSRYRLSEESLRFRMETVDLKRADYLRHVESRSHTYLIDNSDHENPKMYESETRFQHQDQSKITPDMQALHEALVQGNQSEFIRLEELLRNEAVQVILVGNLDKMPDWTLPLVPRYSHQDQRGLYLKATDELPVHSLKAGKKLRATLEDLSLLIPNKDFGLIFLRAETYNDVPSIEVFSYTAEPDLVRVFDKLLSEGRLPVGKIGFSEGIIVSNPQLAFPEYVTEVLYQDEFRSIIRQITPDQKARIIYEVNAQFDGGRLLREAQFIQQKTDAGSTLFPKILELSEGPDKVRVVIEDLPDAKFSDVMHWSQISEGMGIFSDLLGKTSGKTPFQLSLDIQEVLASELHQQRVSNTPDDYLVTHPLHKIDVALAEIKAKSPDLKALVSAEQLRIRLMNEANEKWYPNLPILLRAAKVVSRFLSKDILNPPFLSQHHGDLRAKNIFLSAFEYNLSGTMHQNLKLFGLNVLEEGRDPLYDIATLISNYHGHHIVAVSHWDLYNFQLESSSDGQTAILNEVFWDDEAIGTQKVVSQSEIYSQEFMTFLLEAGNDDVKRLFPFEKNANTWRIRLLLNHVLVLAEQMQSALDARGFEAKVGLQYQMAVQDMYLLMQFLNAYGILDSFGHMSQIFKEIVESSHAADDEAFGRSIRRLYAEVDHWENIEARLQSGLEAHSLGEANDLYSPVRIFVDADGLSDDQMLEVYSVANRLQGESALIVYGLDRESPFYRTQGLKPAHLITRSDRDIRNLEKHTRGFGGKIIHITISESSPDLQGMVKERKESEFISLRYQDELAGTLSVGLRDLQRGQLTKEQIPDYFAVNSFGQFFITDPSVTLPWQALLRSEMVIARSA